MPSRDPGQLDRRVIIQQVVETVGEARGANRTYTTLATVWAKVEPISGREFLAADQERSAATTRVTIRWRAGITTKHRIVHDGVAYGIVHAAEQGRRQWLELTCVQEEE